MNRTLVAVALLMLVTSVSATTARAEPIGTKTLWEVTTKGITSPSRYYGMFQEVVVYEATCRSATRSGQSTYIENVLEGELTVMVGDRKSVYRAGQTAIIPAGLTYWFGNESSVSRVRFQETVIQPDWSAPPTTLQVTPTCPGQVPVPMVRVTISQAPAVVDVTQQGAELSAGYVSPRQTVNALNVITVLSGEVTLRYEDSTVRRLAANQGAAIDMGKPVVLANEGSAPASYMTTWLSAPGASLTTLSPAAQPAPQPSFQPPNTGDAGLLMD